MFAIACGKDAPKSAMSSDLKRDLDLAASSATDLASAQNATSFSPTEIAPSSAPEKSPTLKKAAGKRVTGSKHPTVKAPPISTTEVAAAEAPTVRATEPAVVENAPAPESAHAPATDDDVPAMGRPTPAAIPTTVPAGQGSDPGTNSGGGIGSVLGG